MIKRDDIEEPIRWTEEYLIDNLGVDPVEAEFLVAINNGEITGDIVEDRRPLEVVFVSNRKQTEVDTKLSTAMSRIPMWTNRYREVQTTAQLMSGENFKQIWILGPTEEHCKSCSKLAGKVKRKSFWLASGIQPRASSLSCGGWNCLCELQPTSEPASRGPLPRIP